MKHISILVPNDAVLAAIDDPRVIFSAVNQFLEAEGQPPFFDIQLVGLHREVRLHNGKFSVHTDALISEIDRTDLIFVPALAGDLTVALENNAGLKDWITTQYKQGAEVASLCLGAFLLASTGLLNGKQCSTHWLMANRFRTMFPEVELVDGTIITEIQGLYSSGGATSYWNLLLYLVEKYTSREMAIRAAKYFAIEMNRSNQSAYIMFQGQTGHGDDAVKKAQDFIEHNVHQRISVEQLSDVVAVGRRSLERRFKKATNNTTIEYIQRVKIEATKKGLESSRKSVNELMYEVGYTDMKAFRTVFRKVTGLSPVEYRNRYNRS
ncbi:MAG: helix-turn-helix domain-containing protein [Bacteroidota bacterium]